MVMEVVHEDMGDGNMQCTNHPYRNSTPGGICAICLQEKLGKLVSSSFPVAVFPSSSSSSSRSDTTTTSATASGAATSSTLQAGNGCNYTGYYTRTARLPFVLTQKMKKKKDNGVAMGSSSDSSTSIVFKRSKSIATPRRGMHFLNENYVDDYSPHRRRFWSLFYLSKSSSTVKKADKSCKDLSFTSATPSNMCYGAIRSTREKKRDDFVMEVENHVSPDEASSFDRKVSRSRSVGCGSRSFSGDFFERISTGFGDCTLRRVESQREGGAKPKVQSSMLKNGHDLNIEERVMCGGIFKGFMVNSSSGDESNLNGKSISAHLSHGRSKSWSWAFASPMRAFSKPSSNKRDNPSSSSSSNKNVTPNLSAIPSLLAVGG